MSLCRDTGVCRGSGGVLALGKSTPYIPPQFLCVLVVHCEGNRGKIKWQQRQQPSHGIGHDGQKCSDLAQQSAVAPGAAMPRLSGPTTSAAAHAALAKPAASTSVPLGAASATQYASVYREPRAQRTQ